MPRVKIYQGDCRKILRRLPTGKFDLIVTSPPYDAGKEYEGQRNLQAYTQFARKWLSRIPRLLKPHGSLWLNVGYTKIGNNETLPLTYLYHTVKPPELHLVQELVWHFEGGMAYKKRFTHRTERWMWFARNPDAVYFDLDAVRDARLNRTQDKRNNPLGKNPSDYWYFDRVSGGTAAKAEKTAHPCQFPERMIRRIIRACSPAKGRVLDPFGGSGTTAVVARKLGRRAVLCELQPDYIKIMRQRLRDNGIRSRVIRQ